MCVEVLYLTIGVLLNAKYGQKVIGKKQAVNGLLEVIDIQISL